MNRTWIIILAMGIGTLCLLGIGMKYVIDANPELQAVIRFKTALAEDFATRGVESVSVFALRGKRGHEIRITLPAGPSATDPAALETELMEYFVARFGGKMGSHLAVQHLTANGMGCAGPEPGRRTEMSIAAVRQRVEDRRMLTDLEPRLREAGIGRVLAQSRDGTSLLVDLETTSAEKRAAREVAAAAEPILRQGFGASHYSTMRVRVFFHPLAPRSAAPPSPAATGLPAGAVEVRYDRRGRETGELRGAQPTAP